MHNTITLQACEHKHLLIHHTSGSEHWRIIQHEGSVLKVHVFSIAAVGESEQGGTETADTIRIDVLQQGAHAQTYIYGMGVLRGSQRLNVHTHVEHQVSDGQSEQLFKFALRDNAQGTFCGELIVAPDAQHTEASQTNKNILLSPTAQMRTQPQLEIYADDVKCSHGATTGQLDESALFYMQQRGIDASTARRMLVNAFFHDIISTLDDEALLRTISLQTERCIETK